MIRRSSAPNHLRGQRNQSKRTGTGGAAVVSDLERQYFEFDRKIVAEVLDTLRNAIAEGATQMAMVADEQCSRRCRTSRGPRFTWIGWAAGWKNSSAR